MLPQARALVVRERTSWTYLGLGLLMGIDRASRGCGRRKPTGPCWPCYVTDHLDRRFAPWLKRSPGQSAHGTRRTEEAHPVPLRGHRGAGKSPAACLGWLHLRLACADSLSCGQVFSWRRVRPDRSPALLESGPGGGLSGGGAAGDPVGQVGSVFVDEAEQGRAAAALPGQAEEVQAGDIGDAAPVDYQPVTDYAGDVYPGVVRAVTGGPDHDAGVQAAAVGEPDGVSFRAGHCGPESDPGHPRAGGGYCR